MLNGIWIHGNFPRTIQTTKKVTSNYPFAQSIADNQLIITLIAINYTLRATTELSIIICVGLVHVRETQLHAITQYIQPAVVRPFPA